MSRQVTSRTSLENLKREAKRWLKALRDGIADARARFERALPNGPKAPTLRDVQHALAREYGFDGWAALKQQLSAKAPSDEQFDTVAWFLENACPDHHVRGPSDHNEARQIALRLLRDNPWLASHDFITAVVCGNLEYVERALSDNPALATTPYEGNVERGDSGGMWDRWKYRQLGRKPWEPLSYLCFTRLPIESVDDNAVAIARALLDRGANPNVYFMAGSSHYTPLTGIIGEGEENREPHQRRDELARLLLERGAEPYDVQVLYNIHFSGKQLLWYLELMYEFSLKLGRAADWKDPTWSMIPVGGYGPGASYCFTVAARKNDMKLAEWMLAHGAGPATLSRQPYEEAMRHGNVDVAELLERHGAPPSQRSGALGRFIADCMRLDRAAVRATIEQHPEMLLLPDAMFAAARADRRDVADLLLDLGTSPDVEDSKKQRPLHIAAYEDAVNVGELLIARGAEVDPVEENFGNTPIDAATYAQAKGMIELLGRHSRDLFYLTYNGCVDRVRELLAEDPELVRKAKNNGQLLMWLTPNDEAQAMELAKLLLAHGARPTARTDTGLTTAEYVEKLGLHEVAALLREHQTADSSLRSG